MSYDETSYFDMLRKRKPVEYLVSQVLTKATHEPIPDYVNPKAVQVLETVTQVPWQCIRSQTRYQPIVSARFMLIHYLRMEGLSLKAIGRALGRDHSTIISSLAKHGDYYFTESLYKSQYDRFNDMMRAMAS